MTHITSENHVRFCMLCVWNTHRANIRDDMTTNGVNKETPSDKSVQMQTWFVIDVQIVQEERRCSHWMKLKS